MICSYCGGRVEWKGPLTNLTHTQCACCGERNSQVVEEEPLDDPVLAGFDADQLASIENAVREGCGPATAAKVRAVLSAGPVPTTQATEDTEMLDWLIKHSDATVLHGSAYGPYQVWFRYSGRTTDEFKTPREAIRAAMAAKGEGK